MVYRNHKKQGKMKNLVFRDWKYGDVRAVRTVLGVYINARDLIKVLGVANIAHARNGLKTGKEEQFWTVDGLGRNIKMIFFDEERAYELLGKVNNTQFHRARAWVHKSIGLALNNGDNEGVVEVRTRGRNGHLWYADRFALSQKSCLEAYIEDMGYSKGGKLDGAVLVRSSDLMDEVNGWKVSIGGWENVKITQASLSRDMALLGYQSKMVRGCLWYWVVGV